MKLVRVASVTCGCCGRALSGWDGLKVAVDHRLPNAYWTRSVCPKCGGTVPVEAQTSRYEEARKLVIREKRRQMRDFRRARQAKAKAEAGVQ